MARVFAASSCSCQSVSKSRGLTPTSLSPRAQSVLVNLFSSGIIAVQAQRFCLSRLPSRPCQYKMSAFYFTLCFLQCKQNGEWGKKNVTRASASSQKEGNKLPHKQLNLQREHDMWRLSPHTRTHANYPAASSVVLLARRLFVSAALLHSHTVSTSPRP